MEIEAENLHPLNALFGACEQTPFLWPSFPTRKDRSLVMVLVFVVVSSSWT